MWVISLIDDSMMVVTTCAVTEITIEKCLFPPGLSDLCWPKSTAEADAIKGKWVRVERDLNSVSGLWYLVRLPLDFSYSTTHLLDPVHVLPSYPTS